MEKYLSKIKKSPLFMGITEEELSRMLTCFGATVKKYKSGDMIIRQGDVVSKIYMILEGSVYIEKDSYWGRRIIVQKLNELNNILNSPRQKEVEECYWQLGGESELNCELSLIGAMIDSAEVEYKDGILKVKMLRKEI